MAVSGTDWCGIDKIANCDTIYYDHERRSVTAIITREQAIQVLGGNERELDRRMLGHSDELLRLRGGTVKLFCIGRLGPNPTFELRSAICDGGDDDVREIVEALERGESGLMCDNQMGC
ncbi:MAG TPA: hypothetical protein VJ046_03540 [Candidatus Paceibacterota bacterium]|nr:hypothetical protein [Candidatus Paceibacterota bacterium]